MALAEALRDEIHCALASSPFSIKVAARVERLAEAARIMLQAVESGVETAVEKVKNDQFDNDTPLVGASPAETFGARVLSELVPALSKLGAKKDTDSAPLLVQAIAMARAHGLTDVSAELEKRLLGHVIDGSRPVDPGDGHIVTASSLADLPL